MILIEEFKECVSDDLKTYLNEKRVNSLYEMTILTDEHALLHGWKKMSIRVLRDTGTTQSLIVKSFVLRELNLATGKSVIVQGISSCI